MTHVTACLTLEEVMPSKINLTQEDKEDYTSGRLGPIPVSDTKPEGGFQELRRGEWGLTVLWALWSECVFPPYPPKFICWKVIILGSVSPRWLVVLRNWYLTRHGGSQFVAPALYRLKQEDLEFKACLG